MLPLISKYIRYSFIRRITSLASKYGNEDQTKIISALNTYNAVEFSKFPVAATRINKLIKYRQKNGDIKSLETLLEIEGIGLRVAEKLCKCIIQNNENGINNVAIKLKSQIVNPPLKEKDLENLKNAVGIHIGVNSISWANIDRDNNSVVDWKLFNMNNDGNKKNGILEYLEIVFKVAEMIPYADLYVMEAKENISPSTLQPLSILSHLQYTHLASMLITVLNTSSKHNPTYGDSNNVLNENKHFQKVRFLRTRLPARLFRTLIGTERIATSNVIAGIISGISGNENSAVNFDQHLLRQYESAQPIEKEILGQAFLLVLTFMELCVYKNPNSLKIIAGQR